ncbi:lipoprotein [Desulfosporosinus shakirovi]|uniref:lipoprotein n=1 Tax=Desulfosporosinus shakirovi TaxID=2885154 RepID=UPI001E360B47|nr:lipoprotein [Desulfosporosinus sp. SRJS8]MCB8814517.1 lipoprotein [Desulfosporosinus sp. SRJS8]
MKKIILLFFILLFLSACSPGNTDSSPSAEPLESYSEKSQAVMKTNNVYIPAYPLTMEETIQQFFEQQYNAYTGLQYININYLLDMDQSRNHNPLIWLENLIQRRRLISHYQFCYVETIKYPYTITYEENAKDGRMEF